MRDQQSSDPPQLDLRDARLTEAYNAGTATIGEAEPATIVRLLAAEDATVAGAVAAEADAIAALISDVADRMCRGGRLFYVGAGSSGRLGVLDAAECPPTFGTDPSSVQGIIAGGADALVRSREGAEDDEEAGRAAIREAGIAPTDFVLGIASSGTTPFVRAALEESLARGAGAGLLSCTPPPEELAAALAHLVTPRTGPEAIAGSTRLKAGTATKLVLNTLTTGVMIRLGKVYGNLMVDLRAVSRKLVDRSLRMLEALTDLERSEARRLLVAAGGSVKTAIAMQAMSVDRFTAERRLDACDGFLSRALERFPPGSPSHDYAEYAAGACDGWDRLVERLAGAPDRVSAAVREALDAGAAVDGGSTVRGEAGVEAGIRPTSPTVGRSRAEIAWHLGHLARFEREAIRPRVEAWLERPELDCEDWEDDTAPGREAGDEDLRHLQDRFLAERVRTIQVLGAGGSALLERRGRLGNEVFTVHQFLRGIAHHDDAHAERIRERLHRALFEEKP